MGRCIRAQICLEARNPIPPGRRCASPSHLCDAGHFLPCGLLQMFDRKRKRDALLCVPRLMPRLMTRLWTWRLATALPTREPFHAFRAITGASPGAWRRTGSAGPIPHACSLSVAARHTVQSVATCLTDIGTRSVSFGTFAGKPSPNVLNHKSLFQARSR
jgi:hypothetical protein